MIDFLDQLDKQWLLALNNDYPDFWDYFMFSFSEKLTWIPFYLSIIFVVIREKRKDAWIIILGIILSIIIADQIASGILKDWIARPRPSHDPEIARDVVTVFGYKGGPYGFASSHAANSFALAFLTILIFRNLVYTLSMLTWAIVNSYSRIYLGVHYVGDILAGIIIGIFAAWIVYLILRQIKGGTLLDKEFQSQVKKYNVYIPPITFFATVIVLLIIAGINS